MGGAPESEFRVDLEPSGIQFSAAAGESILDAALRHRVHLPYGCRNGACGSCRGRLRSGNVEYPGEVPRGLSERERAAGWALLCQAMAASDLVIRIETLDEERVAPVRTLPVRVVDKERLAHDVMAVHLELPPSERLQYLAGQYVDILLRDGRRRAFSLANPPHDDARLTLHIRRVPGGAFSEEVFERLPLRTLLRLQGPLGAFYVRTDSQRPMILVAGGTGFAPVKSMIEAQIHEGLVRPIHLYWGTRAERDLYCGDLARSWAREHSQIRFTPVLSEPGPSWTGRQGFVHAAVLEDFASLGEFEIYASGPPAMVHAIRESFPGAGLELEHLFSDTFDYAHETGHDAA